LEGLRKETRAGLEYALQKHKTLDVQMDLNAPIIIIPEEYALPEVRSWDLMLILSQYYHR